MSQRIAILDSDAAELALLTDALSRYRCFPFRHPSELAQHGEAADLLLLDLHTLQGQADDGAALIASARQAGVPVLLSAARNEATALQTALQAGAGAGDGDGVTAAAIDYVLKPLRMNEVQLRVQILLQRAYPNYQDQQQLRFAQYVFETPSNRITRDGVAVEMTQKEFELALLLFGNLGRPLSRAYIQDAIWARGDGNGDDDDELPSRTLDTHISRVRNKLQLKPEHGFRLTPVYGYGYQLEQLG